MLEDVGEKVGKIVAQQGLNKIKIIEGLANENDQLRKEVKGLRESVDFIRQDAIELNAEVERQKHVIKGLETKLELWDEHIKQDTEVIEMLESRVLS